MFHPIPEPPGLLIQHMDQHQSGDGDRNDRVKNCQRKDIDEDLGSCGHTVLPVRPSLIVSVPGLALPFLHQRPIFTPYPTGVLDPAQCHRQVYFRINRVPSLPSEPLDDESYREDRSPRQAGRCPSSTDRAKCPQRLSNRRCLHRWRYRFSGCGSFGLWCSWRIAGLAR